MNRVIPGVSCQEESTAIPCSYQNAMKKIKRAFRKDVLTYPAADICYGGLRLPEKVPLVP